MRSYYIMTVFTILTSWITTPLLGNQSTPQKTGEIHISAICGKGIYEQNNKCEIVLLNELEFSRWTQRELKIEDLKTVGETPLSITGLSEGLYYVGISAEIDMEVYNPDNIFNNRFASS